MKVKLLEKITARYSNPKKRAAEFEIGKEIEDGIEIVHENRELCEAAKNEHGFNEKGEQYLDQLNGARNYPDETPRQTSEPAIINCPDDIDKVTVYHEKDIRDNLKQRYEDCEKKVAEWKEKKTQAEIKAIQQACEHLPPEAIKIFKDVLTKSAELEVAIRRLLKLDSVMASRGITSNLRPARFQVIQFFRDLVFGGCSPSISWVLQQQRKLWQEKKDE